MTLPLINYGAAANDHTGDPLRTAFQTTDSAIQALNADEIILSAVAGLVNDPTTGNANLSSIVNSVLIGNSALHNAVVALGNYTPPFTGGVATTVTAKLARYVDVFDFGAKGDGTTDDTAAIQAAINLAQITCGRIYLPGTAQSYKCTSALLVTAGLTIEGGGFSPYTPNDFNTRGPGSWLQFAHLGQGITINNGSADVTSVFLEKIGTFRNQAAPGVGWTPVAADYDIFVGNGDVHIRNVMLWNPTKGIQINSASGARLDIDGLFGQPLQMGIDCFLAEDVVRIRNVHFWPYWDNDVTYIQAYMRTNLIPLQFERCDNPIVSDFFCIYPATGIVFTSNVNGVTQRAQLSNIGIDVFQTNAIQILSGADGTSLTINGMYGFSGSSTNNGIKCSASSCLIQANAVRFSQLGFCASSINGTGNVAKYSNWIVDGYNSANNSSPCFFTNAGCRTDIADRVQATATNAAPLINSTLNNYNAIAGEGAWSIVNPATSTVVTHGLGWQPAAYQVTLQFNSAPTAFYYVDTITSTQLTIHGAPTGTTNGTWTIDARTT